MNIMELGALGEFLGSIGVIATLVYLAVQIRQNTQSMDESMRFAKANAYDVRAMSRAMNLENILKARAGGIGLWVGLATIGYFRNIEIEPR